MTKPVELHHDSGEISYQQILADQANLTTAGTPSACCGAPQQIVTFDWHLPEISTSLGISGAQCSLCGKLAGAPAATWDRLVGALKSALQEGLHQGKCSRADARSGETRLDGLRNMLRIMAQEETT